MLGDRSPKALTVIREAMREAYFEGGIATRPGQAVEIPDVLIHPTMRRVLGSQR